MAEIKLWGRLVCLVCGDLIPRTVYTDRVHEEWQCTNPKCEKFEQLVDRAALVKD